MTETVLTDFEPFRARILTLCGASYYSGLRKNEFFVFCDDDEWFLAYLPSASVLPTCFLRSRDAIGALTEIMRLRNDWSSVGHDDFLRHLGSILRISDRFGGRQWRTEFEHQPRLSLDHNGYGASAA